MGKINLEQEIIKRFIADGKRSGLNYYNVRIDNLDVSILSIEQKTQDIKELKPKVADKLIAGPNCTGLVQEAKLSYGSKTSSTVSWKLSSTFEYKKDITAKIDIGIELGGSTSYGLSLTGEASGSTTKEDAKTVEVKANVPPCSTLEMPIHITETKSSGKYTLTVKVRGSGTATLDIPWWFDSDVPVIFYEKFTIDIDYDGLTSDTIQTAWLPKKANCDEGPCAKRMLKVYLKKVGIKASGMGNDWQFDVKVGASTTSGKKSDIEKLVFENRYDASTSTIQLPVAINIVEKDPVYDDHGSANGILAIDLNQQSGSGTVAGSAKAVKRDTGSATFNFQFEWKVDS